MATDLNNALLLGQIGQAGQAARNRRALANRLIGSATEGRPTYSLGAALAQGLTGALGGYMGAQADADERTEREAAERRVLDQQRAQRQAQMDEVTGITMGNPVPEGQQGPARPALTGQARTDALAGIAAFNPAAQTQLSLDQRAEDRAFQQRMAEDQRRTQLAVAGMSAAARQPQPTEFDRLLAAAGVAPNSEQARALALSRLERLGQPPQTTVNLPQPDGARLRADTATLQAQNEGVTQARSLINFFDRAEQAVRAVPEGAAAQFLPIVGQTARALGYDIPGTSEAEVLRGITNQLAALQRVPGSGATTDFEMRLFMQAVPRLGNTREGNLQLLDLGRRLAQRRIEEANVWRRFAGSEDLFERLDALGPVFSTAEREFLEKGPAALPASGPSIPGPGGVGTAEPPQRPAAPAPGTVMQGFRFRGGNPADRNNWEPVR